MNKLIKTGRSLLAMLLCMAMLLSNFAGVSFALEVQEVQPLGETEAVAAADFEESALDKLAYTYGTVSAWLEYDCGNGIMTAGANKSYLQVAVDTDYTHFLAYCIKMSQNPDYVNVYEGGSYGTVGRNSDPVAYGRYKAVDGSHIVYVYILNALNEVRVIVDTNAYMTGMYSDGFVYESATGETAQPMVVMYGLSMSENGYHIDTSSTHYQTNKVNSGALIVIRMPDNSLFINDGGSKEQWNDEACDRFMTFLREMTGKSEGEKVVINTWFLSHAHTDHFEGFTRFVDHYHDQIELQSVMYNIDSERLGTARDMTYLLKLFRAYFPGVKYYKPHTGESFNIAGVEFDVVYAQEDRFYPTSNGQEMIIDHLDGKSEYADHGSRNGTYREECFFETVYSYDSTNEVLVSTPTTYDYSDFNDTSTVLKVTFPDEITDASKDMTALLYGDANRVDQLMLKVYAGTDMLKANMMLVPHHGHDAHPELAQVSEADVFLFTQRKSGIFGPNGIVDYGVDVSGTYRPALVYNYMAMQKYLETGRVYWQGTETVCLTFGAAAENLPSGMARDAELAASTGMYAYTADVIDFEYEGWSVVSDVVGSDETSATGVAITTSRIRFDQVTSLKNAGRYMIVHDQTDNVLLYNPIARASGQTKPNLAVSMEVGSGLAASNGLVDAYYKVSDTSKPDVETKTSIYCTRDKRDPGLWILGQSGMSGTGTSLKTSTAKFGGTTAYSTTTFYKGTSSDDAYWYSVKGKDYVDENTGNQWRYLRVSGSPLFYNNSDAMTNWIEFFSDGTCVIYYYESDSSIRFLSVTPEGNWVRSKKQKLANVKDDVLDSFKLRIYEYKTRSGDKTIAYSGPQTFEVLKGVEKTDLINSIAATFRVNDSSARNRPIPCSGTTAKVGYYWLDGTISASSVSTSKITLKYRDDDGKDSTICSVNIKVLESLYLDTVISGNKLNVSVGQTETDGKISQVYNNAEGYVTEDTAITLSMLTDSKGNAVTSNTKGEYTGLTLTYNGQVLANDISLTVDCGADGHSYDGGVITTQPTCTTEGVKTFTCTACGESYTETVSVAGHDYVAGKCSACGDELDFYLFGWINGRNYACEEDWSNLGEFRFVDGQLTAKFESDSYIAVKTDDNAHWYMFPEYNQTTSGTLYNTADGAAEKMFVPGNVEIIFTLTAGEGDSLILTYEVAVCPHEWGEGEITREPTCVLEGIRVYTCALCGESMTEEISTLPHNYDEGVVTALPNCIDEGIMTYTCSGCGDSYIDFLPTTDHHHVAGVCVDCGDQLDFYLFGYINGGNYACEENGSELGEYRFEDGKLVATFAQDSYVAVKTSNNLNWYMFQFYTQDKYGTLYSTSTGATEKMRVPGGVEVEFTLSAGEGDTLVLSYQVVNCPHNYGEGDVIQAPTCTADGVRVYTCSICGDKSKIESVPALNHSYDNGEVTAPSCTADGYTTYTCITCGDSYVSDVVSALGHSWKDATCTESKYCSVCGETEGDALGHTPGRTEENVLIDPDCVVEGMKEITVFCDICGEVISTTTEEIPTVPHDWVSVTNKPTCTEDGYTTYTCSVCGDSYVSDEIQANGHSYDSVVTKPTCTEDGYTTHTCSVCGDSYVDAKTDALGHKYQSVTEDATCTEDGRITYTCDHCGDSYFESISAEGHKYESVVTAPSCTEEGYTTHTCSVCGYSYEDARIDALGHNYSAVVTAPTCIEDGFTTHTCSVCKDSYVDGSVAALGHSYNSVVTAPTCTEDGFTTHTCSACGHNYVDAKTDALGHKYQSVTEDATCTEDGRITYTCDLCGDSYFESISAKGHKYESVVTAPTCTEPGFTTHTCSVCKDSYVDNSVAALGHSYNSVVTAPTCTEDGYTTYTCSACDDSYVSDEIKAAGHNYDAVVTAPTCTEGGYTTYTCVACGDNYVSDEIKANGHSYVGGTCEFCGEAQPVVAPTLKPLGAGLTFKDEIYYNVYFGVTNPDNVEIVEMGVISWTSRIDGTIETAEHVSKGSEPYTGGYLKARSNPVSAKNMGEELYMKVYAKLADGTYVYSNLINYSAKTYAMNKIGDKTSSDGLKALCVSLMNYGASAQQYFGYKTDDLMNAGISAEAQALVSAYSASMIPALVQPGDKAAGLDKNGGFAGIAPSVNFGGALGMNYTVLPNKTVEGDVKLYIWTEAELNANSALTLANAKQVITMTAGSGGTYAGRYTGIAAKNAGDTIYACAVYTSGGVEYRTGVVTYSVAAYCQRYATNMSSSFQPMASMAAVYTYYADAYLNK